jgi:Fic family protein
MKNDLLREDADVRLTTSYWADVNACSPDTALRDIQDLIRKKILHKESGGGRNTSYTLT